MKKEYFLIAKVLKPHGIKGEMKIKIYTEDLDNFINLDFLYILKNNDYTPISVENIRISNGEAFLKLENINSRNEAEEYRDTELYISRDDASPLEEGEYYLSDIIGFRVLDENGGEIGVLSDVQTNYVRPIFTLKTQKDDMLFPSIDGIFKNINYEEKYLVLDMSKFNEVAV